MRYSSLPAFASETALPTSIVTVPVFGFGMSPRGPSTRPELADDAHLVGRGDRDVEVEEALLDLRREIGRADHVGARVLGLARLLALGEDGDAHVLPDAVREHDRPAELLVGVPHVQAEPEVRLDGLVELGGRRCP